MNSQPSAAMENGLTAQLMNSVTPMPRQCSRTLPMAAKSTFTSMGMIISQISDGDRQVDVRQLGRADRVEDGGKPVAERDADDDAERDPEGEVAFEDGHFWDQRADAGRRGPAATGSRKVIAQQTTSIAAEPNRQAVMPPT